MIFEKIVVLLISMILLIYLSIKFTKKFNAINLTIISLSSFTFGGYIQSTMYNIYLPLFWQILVLTFSIILPLLFAYLQFNNIILSKKILYYKIRYEMLMIDFDKAIEHLNKLIVVDARKSEYFYLLGLCFKEKKDFINTRDSFAMAIELNKKDYKSYYELGLVLDETNKKEIAIVMFNNSLRLKTDFYEAAEALGITLTSLGKFADAIKVYHDALGFHPNACEIYYNIAMIELELGNFEKSEESFIKAAELKPKLYSAYYNIGKINYLKGDYDRAIEFYKLARDSSIYGGKAYYKLATVYAAKKEYERAMSSLEYAIEINEEYISSAQNELVFENMRDRINSYLEDRLEHKELSKNKSNYMDDKETKIRVKKKEKVLEEVQKEKIELRAIL